MEEYVKLFLSSDAEDLQIHDKINNLFFVSLFIRKNGKFNILKLINQLKC